MAKITEYPVTTTIENDDVLLVDGAGGTRGLSVSGFSEAVAQHVVNDSQAFSGLVGDVNDLKGGLSELEPTFTHYPTFVRGSGNSNTGDFVPSESTLSRAIEMEFISTAQYNRMHCELGFSYMVFYYDANKAFVSTDSSTWNSAGATTRVLDATKAFVRVLLRKTGGSDFDAVPSDAIYFYNEGSEYFPKKDFSDINTAVYGLAYSESATIDANAANTARWFIPRVFSHGWLQEIRVKNSSYAGIISVELWERSGDTLTRTDLIQVVVGTGDNVLTIETEVKDYTYISLSSATSGVVRASSTGETYAWILRDKESTSFSFSSLITNGYSLVLDVVWYGIPKEETSVFYIGENDNVAEVITRAMEHNGSIVYIEPYEHDCIQEWEDFFGSTYFSAMSSGRGLELKNDIHIIGRSGHKLKCYYTGNNDYVMANFSLFNNSSGGSGYTLENVCIDTKKIRYCIHDERGEDTTPYKVKYLRCIMSQDMTGSTWDHSRACIGGGLGQHGDVLVEDCIFSTVTSEVNMDSLAYHNSAGSSAENSIVIRGCYCTGDSTLQLASYGASALKTKVLVTCCSFGSPVEELDWTGGTPNFDIYYINNEIRS